VATNSSYPCSISDKRRKKRPSRLKSSAKKILAALNQPYQLDQINHVMTASVGITLFRGTSTSVDDILKQADLSMYRSKDLGRDTCRFFDRRMQAALHERIELEASLRQAIEERQFQLY
jgi:predicted signal transduction protein with EAL and GGDEF domain